MFPILRSWPFLFLVAAVAPPALASSNAAQYRYDKSSNLTQVWDGRGGITRFGFGPNDEPTWVRWPDNNQANAYYDAAGRLTRTVDERGIESNYGYIATRLESVQFPAYPAHNLGITWAGFGMPGTITDSTGATTFGYDPAHNCRLLQE